MSHSPNSQDSGGSDLDLDPAEVKLFPEGELFASRWQLGQVGLLQFQQLQSMSCLAVI